MTTRVSPSQRTTVAHKELGETSEMPKHLAWLDMKLGSSWLALVEGTWKPQVSTWKLRISPSSFYADSQSNPLPPHSKQRSLQDKHSIGRFSALFRLRGGILQHCQLKGRITTGILDCWISPTVLGSEKLGSFKKRWKRKAVQSRFQEKVGDVHILLWNR